MIKQEQITLTLARKTIKTIDMFAAEKGLTREEFISEWARNLEQRKQVSNRVQEIARRKRSNRGRLNTALQQMPDSKLSEKELDEDIQSALKAIRKPRRTHVKPSYSRS
jgi:hypothetical protein